MDARKFAPTEEGVTLRSVADMDGLIQATYIAHHPARGMVREAIISRFKGDRLWRVRGACNRAPGGTFTVPICDKLPRQQAIEQASDYCKYL